MIVYYCVIVYDIMVLEYNYIIDIFVFDGVNVDKYVFSQHGRIEQYRHVCGQVGEHNDQHNIPLFYPSIISDAAAHQTGINLQHYCDQCVRPYADQLGIRSLETDFRLPFHFF